MSDTSSRYRGGRVVNPRKPRFQRFSTENPRYTPLPDTQGIKGRPTDVGNVRSITTRRNVQAYVRKYGGSPLTFGLKGTSKLALEQGAKPLLKFAAKAYGGGLVGAGIMLLDGKPIENFGYVFGLPSVTPDGIPTAPIGGFWVKEDGDHYDYGINYMPYNASNLYVARLANYTGNGRIGGQAIACDGLANQVDTTALGYLNTAGFWWQHADPVLDREAQHSNYRRTTTRIGSTSHPMSIATGAGLNPATDANVLRYKDAPLKPSRDPLQRLREREALFKENMANNPSADWIAREFIFEVLPKTDSKLDLAPPKTGTKPSVLPPPLSPIGKTPPGKGEKQAKVMSRAAQIGVRVFRALDLMSESAEVVDALFMALPKDVIREAKKQNSQNRGFVDQAGQYGIDGADWKLKVLYDNWHKIDAAQAVKNILANEVEDRLYGKYHAAKDKVTGRGRYRRNPASKYK